MESKTMRSDLIVFGLEPTEGKTCKELFTSFLMEVMKIPNTEVPAINQAFWKGKGENRPMVIKLSDQQGKGVIFSNVANLKDVKNAKDRAYRILDHVPEEIAEQN